MPDEQQLPPLPKEWLATYAELTAESVLAYSDVVIAPEDIGPQLAAHDSFYAGLVKLPALITFNSLFNGQCRDVQTYCQERLIEYILSGVDQTMVSESSVLLKNQIEDSRLKLISMGELLSDLEARHYQLMLKAYSLQEQQVAKWDEATKEHAERLWETIELCQPDVSPDLKERLLELVRTQAAGITIPQEVLTLLNMATQPSATEKAVLQVFIEAGVL